MGKSGYSYRSKKRPHLREVSDLCRIAKHLAPKFRSAVTKKEPHISTAKALLITGKRGKTLLAEIRKDLKSPSPSLPLFSGSKRLRLQSGNIEKARHSRLDFDGSAAYVGVMLSERRWEHPRPEESFDEKEREELWESMPFAPKKYFVSLKKGLARPDAIEQEPEQFSFQRSQHPPEAIDSSYLRWQHSDIVKFLEGRTHVDPVKLFEDIVTAYRRYCYFESDETYYLLTLWIIGTYLFPLFPAYPLILIQGKRGCGKSRTSKVSSCLAFNAKSLTDPNSSIIYKLAEKQRASLFFDDAEWASGKKATRLMSTLKSSYKRTAKVARVGKNRDGSIDEYEIYSPKMFNNIQGFEAVLASRAIIISQRLAPKEARIDKHDPDEEAPYWAELRNRLYLFTLNYWKDIKDNLPKQTPLPLWARPYELYAGILSIAEFIDSKSKKKGLHERMFNLAVRDVEERESEELEADPKAITLRALLALASVDGWRSTAQIASAIRKVSTSPQKLSPEEVGRILKKLGFGIKAGEFRRRRSDQGRKAEYFIRRSVVLDRAKRHGIPVT